MTASAATEARMASNASTAALFFIPTASQEAPTLTTHLLAYVDIPRPTASSPQRFWLHPGHRVIQAGDTASRASESTSAGQRPPVNVRRSRSSRNGTRRLAGNADESPFERLFSPKTASKCPARRWLESVGA
jgi:hypothetical protein